METKTLAHSYDNQIITYAVIAGGVSQLLLWFMEEGRHDLSFLFSLELLPFLLFTMISASFIIGAYFALRGLRLGAKSQLLLALLVGNLPTLGILSLILFS